MKKGISIVEMLAVVIIMGILAAIAVPLVGGVIDKARKEAFIGDISAIQQSAQLYCNRDSKNTSCLSTKVDLKTSNELQKYISKNFKNYNRSSVRHDLEFAVDLKDKEYETRQVTYDANSKTYTYTQTEIIPNTNIKNHVIKNKK